MIFKCKNCGGNSVYSPEKHGMFCPYCESEGSDEQVYGAGGELTLCPNCGGEVPVETHTAATQCPYCDSYVIFDERVSGAYLPRLIIPFQMGKEKCKETIKERFKKCVFAPTDFLSEVKLNTIHGDYVPFWFYDYDTSCDYQAEATKVRSWRSGDVEYTETSYYNVVRNVDVAFEKIPVDASEKMPDDVMDLLEPFSYENLEEFKPQYMSGFMAEKYNYTSDMVEMRAVEKRDRDVENLVKATCVGYNSVRTQQQNVYENNKAANYGFLPVWKYDYKYKDKEYPFYVNGQTGKVVGEVPVSKPKVWAYAGTLWACMTVFMILANIILTH
ncbi:MAG: hypothetical protein IJF07_07560 [Lachnospiraceae bacterium]|nr:hypothetical protein [Lachnospiraceae bacterium]